MEAHPKRLPEHLISEDEDLMKTFKEKTPACDPDFFFYYFIYLFISLFFIFEVI